MKCLLMVVAAAILLGCAGTNFSWDAARKLRLGMKEAEVVELMGTPNNVRAGPEGTIWVWVWVNPYSQTKTLTVTMRDGALVKVPDIPQSFQ